MNILLELCECDELFIYLSEGNYIFDRSILPTEIDLNASWDSGIHTAWPYQTWNTVKTNQAYKPTSFLTSSRGLSKSVMESSFSPNTWCER